MTKIKLMLVDRNINLLLAKPRSKWSDSDLACLENMKKYEKRLLGL